MDKFAQSCAREAGWMRQGASDIMLGSATRDAEKDRK